MRKILITGSEGQVGCALCARLQGKAEVQAHDRQTLDITDRGAVLAAVRTFAPDVIINAAAYTAVDKAESEADTAHAVNADGVRYLAQAAAETDALLLHISTDYVFSGDKADEYLETDAPNPQTVYGKSKLAGEEAALAAHPRTIILRTAWVFGEHGHNFVKTMLRLARERERLGVVADQFGAPTYAGDIADALIAIGEQAFDGKAAAYGIYHYSGTPHTNWCDFARAIFAEALAQGILAKAPQVDAITTADYPTPAQRPANSRLNLDKIRRVFAIAPSDWQQALKSLHLYQ
ncbi:MAG: dTDP-4-dehydrorhamnose reductase [Cardiobacteriaceae bacterium]|nr:dTDP-4-dehydrorhamnose reductase [Cardiobacteriaceae bacterium]